MGAPIVTCSRCNAHAALLKRLPEGTSYILPTEWLLLCGVRRAQSLGPIRSFANLLPPHEAPDIHLCPECVQALHAWVFLDPEQFKDRRHISEANRTAGTKFEEPEFD